MKKTLIGILLFSLTFSFLSCGSDDDSLPEDFNPIVGTWLRDSDSKLKVVYTEDFVFETYIYSPHLASEWELISTKEYFILKKGEITLKPTGKRFYKLENSKLYLRTSPKDEWNTFTRITN